MEEAASKPMTSEDLEIMKSTLANSYRVLKKIALGLFGFFTVMLFVPAELLKFLGRRTSRSEVSGTFFSFIGLSNTIFFILIPIVILLVLIYFLGANKMKKDIKEKQKVIGVVKVKAVLPLSQEDIKDVLGTADHRIKFEKNSYAVVEDYFLASLRPELLKATAYEVEVSKHSKVELSRRIV